MTGEVGTNSKQVTIVVSTETKGYECEVVAKATWTDASGETFEARSGRSIDLYKAEHINGVSVKEFIEATKRDALRELVTNLNIYEVLS